MKFKYNVVSSILDFVYFSNLLHKYLLKQLLLFIFIWNTKYEFDIFFLKNVKGISPYS